MKKVLSFCFVLLAAALTLFTQVHGQTTTKTTLKDTVIHVEDLDCEACAEIIIIAFKDIPGVDKVKIDTDKHTATVTPHLSPKTMSPKALWEAVEECGFVPTKLEGPSGTFTKKPPS